MNLFKRPSAPSFLRIRVLMAVMLFCVPWARADLPVSLVNNSHGDFADNEIYVGIIGQQGSGYIYYDLAASSQQKCAVVKPLSESLNTLHAAPGDWGYADVWTRLSDIQDKTIWLGNTHACRIFFSFKSPMYLHAFPNGYSGADMNNPNDPNAQLRWELVEFTYEPEYTDFNGKVGQIWINHTRVDAFQYPIGLELYGQGELAGSRAYQKRGELMNYNDIIRRWNATLGSTVYKDCYSSLITKDNLGGIIKQPSKVSSIKDKGIFDAYINRIWDYFRTHTANIDMGLLGRWEGKVEGDAFILTCREGTYWGIGSQGGIHSKPTSEDAIEGAGCFAEGSAIDKTLQTMFCAAFNRGQFRPTETLQDWNPETGIKAFSGGSEYPCNEYVKFFHDPAVSASNGYTYSFSYDDTYDQSATCYTTVPTKVVITLGGFADGGGIVNPDPVDPDLQPGQPGSAPAPQHAASSVKSLFSGQYPTVAPGFLVGSWGQTTKDSKVECGGNEAYRFDTFNYLGLQVSDKNDVIDMSGMTHLHLDLYAPEEMTVNIYPISLNPTVDSDKATRNLEAGKWNSIDLPLAEFPSVNFKNFGQIKFDGGDGTKTFYLDNIYFYKNGGTVNPDPVDPDPQPGQPGSAPAPQHSASDVKSFFSDAYTSVTPEMFVGGWGQATKATIESLGGNNAYKLTDFNYLGFQFSGRDDILDIADMKYLHIDLYATADMDVNLFPISLNPTKEAARTLHVKGGEWNSFDMPLGDFPSVDFHNLGQFKLEAVGSPAPELYLDNLYAFKNGTSTGIENIAESDVESGKCEIFDLLGRRVPQARLKQGIYIINGKKVIMI